MVTVALAVFVFVLLADVLALLIDASLWLESEPTITSRVKARPVLGVPIILWQVIGIVALTIHFWA